MIKYYLIIALLLPLMVLAQKSDKTSEQVYGYSFVADMDSSLVEGIANQVSQLKGIEKAKGFYKPEKKEGFIMIYVTQKEMEGREDIQDPFNVADFKNLLIRNNLEPKDLRRLR